MPNVMLVQQLISSSEQERINFFFGAIVAKTWNVLTLEQVLREDRRKITSLETLLADVSQVSAFGNVFSRLISSRNSLSQPVQAKVQEYKALSIVERINRANEFEALVLQLDTSLYDHNPILVLYNKDFNLFRNVQVLISTYAAGIYEKNPTADSIRLLNSYFETTRNNIALTTEENQPLLKIYMVLSSAIVDPVQKQEFITLFKICLKLEIDQYAGLNKTRKFLLSLHAHVNQSNWDSVKSKTTIFGNGKTPGGISAIRTALKDINEKELEDKLVSTLFLPIYRTLAEKNTKKPFKRTDTTHAFYTTQYQQATAMYKSEVEPFCLRPRNARP